MGTGGGAKAGRGHHLFARAAAVLVFSAGAPAVVASPAAADPPPSAETVAAQICSEIYAKLGFERFSGQFGTPESCPGQVADDVARALAACAGAPDPATCVESRARSIVDRRVLGERFVGELYTTASGARVRVVSSEASGAGEAERLAWAEFLDSLLHGQELVSVTLQLRSPQEVQDTCAPSALACYIPSQQTIVASPADQPLGPGAESLVAHEYGHHVARNRLNPPSSALMHGTKRWATYMRVCERVRSHEFPDHRLWGPAYRLSPAEGFAEAYRVLNEQRLASFSAPWMLVDDVFRPDAEAIRALEQDVVAPWTGPTTVTLTGRGGRSFRIQTPLDGAVQVKIAYPAGSRYRVSAPRTVCGERRIVVHVRLVRGSGLFRLTISTP